MKRLFMISGLTDLQKAGNQSFLNTIKYLSSNGFEIDVFNFGQQPEEENYMLTQAMKKNVKFHRMPLWISRLMLFAKNKKSKIGGYGKHIDLEDSPQMCSSERIGYFSEYNVFGLLTYVAFFLIYLPIELLRVLYYSIKSRPDLIYGYEVYGAVVAVLLGKLIDRAVITRFQGTALTEHDLEKPTRKLMLIHHIIALKAPSEAIIMANDGTRGDVILEKLGVRKENICFWLNGLDVRRMLPVGQEDKGHLKRKLGIEGRQVLVMVSKLKKWKRVDRGIRCVHALQEYIGVENLVLLIIGDGPERNNLTALAEQLGVSDKIIFLGETAFEKVNRYYQVADIFLSLYDISNLGNPVLEALYYGAPIVSIDDGSTKGILEDGENAILVPCSDIDCELPNRVYLLLKDEEKRRELACRGKNSFANTIMSWEKRMDMEIDLIHRLAP